MFIVIALTLFVLLNLALAMVPCPALVPGTRL
jgi:hypothetical protein